MTTLAEEGWAALRSGDVDDEFVRQADAFRPELLAHCYRMLGSIHDAEDLVQETYLRAWRSHDAFEGRASLRTWLYRIATNVCLTALEKRGRRPMPSGLGGPTSDPEADLPNAATEVLWLQPFPDAMTESVTADPASIVAARAGMRLALIAAFQHLHPRQRAVLILRDVLGWRASEVAELLDVSATAVNSLLQRAHTRLEQVAPEVDDVTEPTDAEQRVLVDRYATAFEEADMTALMDLLTDDAIWEMPPQPAWFQGREVVVRLIAYRLGLHSAAPADRRLVPTRANGQPAFGFYLRNADGVFRASSLQVLTIEGNRVARVSAFRNDGLFEAFGLPSHL